MSNFEFPCPSCAGAIRAEPEHSGMSSHCPHCHALLVVPSAPSQSVPISPQSTTPDSKKRPKIAVFGIPSVVLVSLALVVGFNLYFSDKPTENSVADIDPEALTLLPLSDYRENKYWNEFFESDDRVVQLVNYDPELRKLSTGKENWIASSTPSIEKHSFLMGFSFVQRVGNLQQVLSNPEFHYLEGELKMEWKNWFEKINTGDLDEFEFRDLTEAEKNAATEILSQLARGTPYHVSSDINYELEDYDFSRGIYPLRSTPELRSVFGNLRIQIEEHEAIHVAEEHARKLREKGVSSISVRRIFKCDWGFSDSRFYWISSDVIPESVDLSPLASKRLPSSEDWTLSAPGDTILALRPKGAFSPPDSRVVDSFSRLLQDFHSDYIALSSYEHDYLTFMVDDEGLSVDAYSRLYSDLLAKRDGEKLIQLSDQWGRVKSQFALLDASEELESYFESYSFGIMVGSMFMKTGTPQTGLKHLQAFLRTHPQMKETYQSILTEVETLTTESEQQ